MILPNTIKKATSAYFEKNEKKKEPAHNEKEIRICLGCDKLVCLGSCEKVKRIK